ncbi:MAG: hydroxyacylglutathione hydrolase [Rhodoplanes sp.]
MPAQNHLFLCLRDNYGVLVHDPATGATASIDAPEAGAVDAALAERGWRLTDILVTHHHGDHTAGIVELKERHGCRVTGPAHERNPIAGVDVTVSEGEIVKVGSLEAQVIETPGHTAGHIAYWFPKEKAAFVGDTLFSIGCGRLFEGSAETMWNSLVKLRALPDDTRIYCGHEYTQSNIRFALTVEPDNEVLKRRAADVDRLLAGGRPTVPSVLGEEKQANPFLRADLPQVAAAVGLAGKPAEQVFGELRERKNLS